MIDQGNKKRYDDRVIDRGGTMPTIGAYTENVSGKFRQKLRNEIKQTTRMASSYLSETTVYQVYLEEVNRLLNDQANSVETQEDEEFDEDEDPPTNAQKVEARMHRREERSRNRIAQARLTDFDS